MYHLNESATVKNDTKSSFITIALLICAISITMISFTFSASAAECKSQNIQELHQISEFYVNSDGEQVYETGLTDLEIENILNKQIQKEVNEIIIKAQVKYGFVHHLAFEKQNRCEHKYTVGSEQTILQCIDG